MSTTDPIADLLTRIRNAITAAHRTVVMPSSNAKREVARILKEQGYISDVSVAPATAHPGEPLKITCDDGSPVRVQSSVTAPEAVPRRPAAAAGTP